MSIYKPRDYLNLALILINHLALKCAFGESYNELYSRYNYSPPSYMMSVFHQLQVDAIYQYLPSLICIIYFLFHENYQHLQCEIDMICAIFIKYTQFSFILYIDSLSHFIVSVILYEFVILLKSTT